VREPGHDSHHRDGGIDGGATRAFGIGVQDTAMNIRNKVARGGFSAVFFVQCLRAIGVRELHLHG
jgi:Domain of unknown function (DUF6471)